MENMTIHTQPYTSHKSLVRAIYQIDTVFPADQHVCGCIHMCSVECRVADVFVVGARHIVVARGRIDLVGSHHHKMR